jgi:2-oxoglutarate dehydrogenase E2 component (dihydrolipoamide succinyltransferase)
MMDVIMPQLGETVAEGVVTRWYKTVGDSVKADEMLFDVETDKVSTEIPAPASGVIAEILVEAGVTAKVGARLAVIREAAGAAVAAPAASQAAPATAAAVAAPEPRATRPAPASAADRLSPVVRRLIAEHQLNPAEIKGTGREGRLTRQDVLGFLESRTPTPGGGVRTEPPAPYIVAGQTRKPLNSVRRRTARTSVEVVADGAARAAGGRGRFLKVEQAREAAGAAWKAREGFALTYLPFIARAVSVALAKFPLLTQASTAMTWCCTRASISASPSISISKVSWCRSSRTFRTSRCRSLRAS